MLVRSATRDEFFREVDKHNPVVSSVATSPTQDTLKFTKNGADIGYVVYDYLGGTKSMATKTYKLVVSA